ncbi:MAG: tetratricopeptide repeat protein [Bdellovibrio sp.]|nr:tetratricopeptide repeat protein [Bdellovibrio sp.]
MKKFIVILVSSLLIALGMFFYSARNAPTQIIPYPYLINVPAPNDRSEAENANILLVGDRMAISFARFMPALIQDLSGNLRIPLKFHTWAVEGEGLHRTLARLKHLSHWPKVIIYLGGSEEGFENKFDIKDYSKIMLNFKLFSNPKIATLIMTMPFTSKVLYTHPQYVLLGESKVQREEVTFQQGHEELSFLKLSFKLFESEMRELHTLAREHESSVIMLTSPINLEVQPKKVCSDMITATTMTEEVKIQDLFEQGNYKEAFNILVPIANTLPGNANIQFMLGKAARESGQLALAKDAFYKSVAFDCELWRTHPVFNGITRHLTQEFGQTLVDFDLLVNGQYGKDALFLNDTFPQDVYFKLASNLLKEKLKKIFNI